MSHLSWACPMTDSLAAILSQLEMGSLDLSWDHTGLEWLQEEERPANSVPRMPGCLSPSPGGNPCSALSHGLSLQVCELPPTGGGRSQGCISGGLGGDWEEA